VELLPCEDCLLALKLEVEYDILIEITLGVSGSSDAIGDPDFDFD
jgi:hypothetical protein